MEIRSSDVRGRSQVYKLAPLDPKAALVLARGIKHPWYRCQSLAAAAQHLKGKEQMAALSAALAAARAQREPNRIVTVASWPLQVLAQVNMAAAAEWIDELVTTAATEPHNLRRAHSLQSLAMAVSSSPALLTLIVPALAEALMGGHGPRIDRVICDTFELVRSTHPELLRPLAMHHKANGRQARLLATLPG